MTRPPDFPLFLSNFSCLYGRWQLELLVFISITYAGKKVIRIAQKTVYSLTNEVKNWPTVETAEIRQKKEQNQGVESPKLSGIIAVSIVQLSQFESSTFFSAIAETLVKQEFHIYKN